MLSHHSCWDGTSLESPMPISELNIRTGSPRWTLIELCLGLWVVHYQKEVDVCLYVPRERVSMTGTGGDLVGVEASLPETVLGVKSCQHPSSSPWSMWTRLSLWERCLNLRQAGPPTQSGCLVMMQERWPSSECGTQIVLGSKTRVSEKRVFWGNLGF